MGKKSDKSRKKNKLENIIRSYIGEDVVDMQVETEEERKPMGYWKKLENVEAELLKIINKIGHFPTQKEVRRYGKPVLSTSLIKYHKGLLSVKETMGYGDDSRPRNYWKTFENVRIELIDLTDSLGHFPTYEEFKSLNRQDLLSGIQKNHGGLDVMRKKLGFSYLQKPKKYWMIWENVEKEMREVIDRLGHFPTKDELEKLDRNDLSLGIQKYHRGINDVRTKLGYNIKKRANGYLKNFDVLVKELLKIITDHPELHGRLPTDHWLRKNRYFSVSSGIYNYHGGIDNLRKTFYKRTGISNQSKGNKLEHMLDDYIGGENE